MLLTTPLSLLFSFLFYIPLLLPVLLFHALSFLPVLLVPNLAPRTDTITHSWIIQDFEAKTRHFKVEFHSPNTLPQIIWELNYTETVSGVWIVLHVFPQAGESLCSPSFTLGATHLVVKVFPSGTVYSKNHVSIFLANQGQQPFDISEIDFTFAPSSACPLSKSAPLGPKKELQPEEDWGFQRFVTHRKLKEKRLLSEDGALHLVTRVKTSSEGEGAEGLVPRLWDMYTQGAFTDFNLVCDGQSLPCHKVVLAARLVTVP